MPEVPLKVHLPACQVELTIAGQEKGPRLNFPMKAGPPTGQVVAPLPAAGVAGTPRQQAWQA